MSNFPTCCCTTVAGFKYQKIKDQQPVRTKSKLVAIDAEADVFTSFILTKVENPISVICTFYHENLMKHKAFCLLLSTKKIYNQETWFSIFVMFKKNVWNASVM